MLNYFRRIKNRHYVILALAISVFFFDQMCASRHDTDGNPLVFDSYGQAFAGSASCEGCHKDIYKSHIATAHYRDSRPASAATIKGSFDSGRNRFVFNSSTEMIMEHKGDGFFQTALVNGKEYKSEPFDIVIGTGKKGQTYLYYDGDGKLYQLPISYSTSTDSWCNSPGYYPDSIRFNRQINAYCLECHGTYAGLVQGARGNDELIDKKQIIYGIDCERCHGPAAEHVNYHEAHPEDRVAKYIINPKSLSRQRRLDACALCHSGARQAFKPAFSFKVGDRLSDFSGPGLMPGSAATLDVHGNQYGLLSSSKCFIQSQMDCSSCHNVHVNEVNSPKLFSQRCMGCHNQPAHNTCTMPPTAGLVLSDNCIDCHMPAQVTQKIALQPSGVGDSILSRVSKLNPIFVRTHRIAIYPESTKQYLEKIGARKAS